jgi:cell division protein FtsQ
MSRRRQRRRHRSVWRGRCWPGLRGLAALAVLALLGTGFARLRESSAVEVREVSITGLQGRAAPAIRAALVRAATDMTTLHVRMDELRRAVAPYPIVKDLKVSTDFPHRLEIRVVEYDAVAAVVLAGRRVPVAADGTLLRDERAPAGLPTVSVRAGSDGERLSDRRALGAVAVLGAAPRELRSVVGGIRWDAAGLHVELRPGPRLDFGGAGRPRAKWVAAARVLSDPRAAGASYLDLRVPERPLAGTFPDDAPADASMQAAAEVAASGPGAEVEPEPTLDLR